MLQTLVLPWQFITDTDYWLLSRAASIVAFLFLWGAVLTGILLKTKLLNGSNLNASTRVAHYAMARLGFYLAIFHVLILRYDSYAGYDFGQLMFPMVGNNSIWALEIGKWSLYATIIVGAVFFAFRKRTSLARWAHLLAYPAFFLALAHGLMLGPDTEVSWMQTIYEVTAGSVAMAGIYYVGTLFNKPIKA